MAGSRTQSGPRKGQKGARGGGDDGSARAYAREAVTEWGNAARLAAAAMRARRAARGAKPPLKERLNPTTTSKGGRIGDAADWLLGKSGLPGRIASKLSLGSRMVERLRPGDSRDGGEAQGEREQEEAAGPAGVDEKPPVPIQESIDLAVPIEVAWDLCKRFADYPEFVERLDDVDFDRRSVIFTGQAQRRTQVTEVEIVDEHPAKRIDWEAHGGFEHSGAVSFHPLAPGLTRIELSIDLPAGGPLQRLRRRLGLTERAIVADLRRFKAYAELWQDVEEPLADDVAPDEEPQGPADADAEEFEDEDFEEEELEEEELGDEDEEEYEEEPDRAGSR